jgi:hypothetical protein
MALNDWMVGDVVEVAIVVSIKGYILAFTWIDWGGSRKASLE